MLSSGILEGVPAWDEFQAGVLVNTPGIPLEWIYACLKLGQKRRSMLRAMIGAEKWVELGKANAALVEPEDGWRMLLAIPTNYRGAVPLYSQLWLQGDGRSAGAIAGLLASGISASQVRNWRKKAIFCPLTGVRLVKIGGKSPI